ncbi:MAG: right-handed parallel beta-helix repeat-containing protein [Deltaproteobacteria bacterium]|nr:right-handed parallel beta-helix repeat-containing protein [Deltaproteobacteria bacterium]
MCDVAGTKTCVQCVAPNEVSACAGSTPVCGDDHACRPCAAHAECTSSACLPEGSCGNDSSVAYVDPTGTDNAMCTQAMPCTSVAKALATNRGFVKLKGTTDEAVTITNGRKVTFLADPNATLTRTAGNGAILTVQGDDTELHVFDLSISNAPNSPSGIGLVIPAASGAPKVTLTRSKLTNNPGGGASVAGGTFTVSESTISNNAAGGMSVSGGTFTVSRSTISSNAGGGISIGSAATFVVVGNVFFANGTQLGLVGGVSIGTALNPVNRLEFNSFNKNQVQDSIGNAIHCVAGAGFTARNNAMSGNGTATNMQQTSGSCAHTFSIARPGTLPPGTGNSANDPMFADTTTGDLHIAAGSPARKAADPASDLTGIASHDIDGDARTSPADIGADQVP